ncbi:acetylornithine transaminase [Youngiibacter multivorans]|uniref:Acetylornithine aminotransferase n=1 Tax=Youngiibacter multivorans TaxID=937251 RepID=A0ABS4G1W7_9CLOT|nr:acetylornithine transaminase [Youngiibacter multivorans]MBP1918482.1 acetylornithine aminotransferase [Youngiibacter multivorans]
MSYLYPTYARYSIRPKEGKGSYIITEDGEKYLDYIAGIAVLNLGHRPDNVEEAVINQVKTLWHMSNLFPSDLQERVAKRLTDAAHFTRAFFCNSGAEANEAAIKLSRKYTGRSKFITFKQSFHGRTFATMSATGQDKIKKGYGEMLGTFVHIPYNQPEILKDYIDEETAGVIVETVQGEGGILVAKDEFLKEIERLCNEKGALFIVDDVQAGIGRTGKAFSFQNYDVKPDLVTLAKGLGNGLPVGALLGDERFLEAFGPGTHGTTFGGNYIAMASAEEVLKTIFQEEFLKSVAEKGEYLMGRLREVLKDSKEVVEVRGKGLLIGIEINTPVADKIARIHENKLLVLPAGTAVVRILPPLNTTYEEMDEAIEKIRKSFE